MCLNFTTTASCLSFVPEKGTVGASGDLAPLSHLALGLMGEGKMWSPKSGWADAKYVSSYPLEACAIIYKLFCSAGSVPFACKSERLWGSVAKHVCFSRPLIFYMFWPYFFLFFLSRPGLRGSWTQANITQAQRGIKTVTHFAPGWTRKGQESQTDLFTVRIKQNNKMLLFIK